MKKWQLIARAYEKYPKGTKFIGAYGDKFVSSGEFYFTEDGEDIINKPTGLIYDGSTGKWAELVENKEPLLVSEDGVELFEGDTFFAVLLYGYSRWRSDYHDGSGYTLGKGSAILNDDNSVRKAFSTKEAAEDWIKEANKPKEVAVMLSNGKVATVGNNLVIIRTEAHGKLYAQLFPSDIEDISHALKSL